MLKTFVLLVVLILNGQASSCSSEPNGSHQAVAWQRPEILLEFARSEELKAYLERRFPDIKFTLHPSMSGFYVEGNLKDILKLKSIIGELDQPPYASGEKKNRIVPR